MPEIEISIKELTKSFGPQTVLEDITFDVPKGKITLMLGPSGTGKSVFLKHLVGLLKPDRGEIWIDGRNVPALSEKELYEVRRKFGVLFQDGALFGSMNIYDNVCFPLREHTRKSEKEIKSIVSEKLGMVGLHGAEKKLPGEISGGMKKRAGLARALVLDPEIILFDEPDSGLDPVRTAFLNELILDLNRQLRSTFIVVTHDIATARRVADFIGMLYRRNLVRFGPAKDMFDSEIPVVRQFLSGDTEGPIGMSEEKDQTKPQLGEAPEDQSRQQGQQQGQPQQQGQTQQSPAPQQQQGQTQQAQQQQQGQQPQPGQGPYYPQQGEGDGAFSTSGMSAQETEEAERAAGAPGQGSPPRRKQG